VTGRSDVLQVGRAAGFVFLVLFFLFVIFENIIDSQQGNP